VRIRAARAAIIPVFRPWPETTLGIQCSGRINLGFY
jgi:hypothetical protein